MSRSVPFCCIAADAAVLTVQVLTITPWKRAPQG